LSKYLILVPPATQGLEIIKPIVAFFSISFLFFGSNVVLMMSSYAEPQEELSPQLQQKLQQQAPSGNVTTSPSQLQQQAPSGNVTTSPSPQLQQQAPPITFQLGPETGGEPCDGAYFVGPGGVTKCM
jgi:hypothetical protein